MATFAQTSGQSIDEMFAEFDAANPSLYARFKAIALQLIASGKRRYSSKTILCVLRYEHDLTTNGDEEFKINDVVTSRYARKFVTEFPEHRDFFQMRELRSQARPAGSLF
jgi:hypothetical protein